MKTILVAVDLSPVSSHVIKEAITLAESLSAKITLLSVIPPVSSAIPVGSSMEMVSVPVPLCAEEIKDIKIRLENFASPITAAGISVHTVVKEAFPVDEIIHQLETSHAYLLVVGSHGHGGLYHLFNGSVVTELLKKSKKPVLVVPIKKAD